MKNLYSIWTEPERIKQLEDSGIPKARIGAAFEKLRRDAELSPANFRYAGNAAVKPDASATVGKRRNEEKSVALRWAVFRVVLRKLKNAPVKTDAQGRLMLPPGPMRVLSRKLGALDPGASYAERRDEISDMIKACRSIKEPAKGTKRKNRHLPAPAYDSAADGRRQLTHRERRQATEVSG
jgi:hypothetical protein